MIFKSHYVIKLARRLNLNAWLYSFIYRGLREISKKHGVRITTNNYGYYPTEIDAHDKYQLQMYDEYAHLLEKEDVEQVLEIGSGAGGGLMHMQSRLPLVNFTGLDRCKEAVRTCKYFLGEQQKSVKLYTNINDILADGTKFDAIVSVETGISIQPDIFDAIHQLLNDNGVFISYDNCNVHKLYGVTRSIECHGFKIEFFKDITANVFKACELDTPRRLEIMEKYLPVHLRPFRDELQRYMCVKDSLRYINFSNGIKKSFLLKARKTNSARATN